MSEVVESRWLYLRISIERFIYNYIYMPLKIIWHVKLGFVGLCIITFYILMAAIGPLVVPYPKPYIYPRYLPPSLEHPFGTDHRGADIFGMIVWGAKDTLIIGFYTGTISMLIGLFVGLIAGYKGGVADRILDGAINIFLNIPATPIVIIIASIMRSGHPAVVALLLTITAWAGFARAVRALTISIKAEAFIEVAKSLGLPDWFIMLREVLPNMASYLANAYRGTIASAIAQSQGIYFLGLVPFYGLNWGIISNMAWYVGAQSSIRTVHFLLAPMIMITLLQIGFALLSYAIDAIFNPRLREEME
ncbi:MAG: ABC transporter permease [Ignisphaera sp.]